MGWVTLKAHLKELFSSKLDGEAPVTRERKMSSVSQASMKNKWIKAFKSLKTPPPEPEKREMSPEEFVDVEMEAEWKSNYPWFLFEVDMPSTNLARAFAKETWSSKLFQNMKDAHQSHYEQMGYLSGHLKVDGKTYQLKEINAFRDHSYGFKRDWSLMHRYIYHMFYLDDRTKISVGLISQPCTSSSIEMGYVNHPDGRQDPIQSIDLQLYQHGENGVLPKELCFVFIANGTSYEAKIKYEHDAVHFKGKDVHARMHERFGTVEVNGVKGRFISEWNYNNCK